jgi:hypothetical protein
METPDDLLTVHDALEGHDNLSGITFCRSQFYGRILFKKFFYFAINNSMVFKNKFHYAQ